MNLEKKSKLFVSGKLKQNVTRKGRKNSSFKVAWKLFEDFCNNSTVHGVKYFGERDRHWIERTFWIIAFFVSLCGCSVMIYKSYVKWQQSPVIVSFADKSTPVWQIPFPAVTFCPEIKNLKQHVDFTKGWRMARDGAKDNITHDELRNLEALAQVCDPHLFNDISSLNSGLRTDEIVPILKSISIPLNETVLYCKWRNSYVSCSDYFTEILTEEGVCYTFNALDFSEVFREEIVSSDFEYLNQSVSSEFWSLEKGYLINNASAYPRRVLGTGTAAGLIVVLKLPEVDFDYICRGPVQGFKVLLHIPGEIPKISKKYYRVPMHQEVVVTVKPNMITTSDGLIDYPPNKRQCFFENEGNLKFFKVYTQNNCEMECLANFTLNECGCVKFSMPREPGTRICSQSEVSCYSGAEDSLMTSELSHSLASSTSDNKRGTTFCNCLPSCTSINYDMEISQAEFEFSKVMAAFGENMDEFGGAALAKMMILFKEAQFITSKRSELYGLSDFMASCGGLLGLFMGVSILSLIEMLYYVTLRLSCNVKDSKARKLRKTRKVKEVDSVPGIKIGF